MLGIDLTDADVGNVPLLRTDPYGDFIRGPNGMPQIVAAFTPDGHPIYVEGSLGSPINPSPFNSRSEPGSWAPTEP